MKTDAKAVNFCLKLVKKYLTEEQFKKLCQIAKIYKSKYKKSKKILHHGDLNLSNLKIDDNKNLIGIIDFECVGFYIPENKIKNQWHDEIIYKSVLEEYYKLSGYLINDRKFSEVCEIITMILHLNRFYSLGKEQIELRVNIIQDLIDKF